MTAGSQSGAITKMAVTIARLPVTSVRSHGIGDVADAVEIVVLRLETEDGLVGWGEGSPWAVFTGTVEANAAALDRYLRPLVVGADPATLPRLMAQADRHLAGHPEAKAALETALLDLAGRAAGLPVHGLLGGRHRDRIKLSVSLANPDFGADRELADQLHGEGIRLFKVKTGFAGHAFDLKRLETLSADYPDVEIRIDYNQGLEPYKALRCLRDMESFRPGFIEQPVPAEQRETLAALTAALDTPVLADESVFTPADMVRAAAGRIADLVSVKIMKCGGLRRGQEIAAIAQAAGMAAYGGDMFESGLAHLAGAHMIAATPNISLGCEFYQARWYLERDILESPFPIEDGHVVLPRGPGLGIAVDEEVLRHFAVESRT